MNQYTELKPSPSNWLDEAEEEIGISKTFTRKPSPKKQSVKKSPKQADCIGEKMEQCLEVVKDLNIMKEELETKITVLNKRQKRTQKEYSSNELNKKNTTRNLKDIESKIESLKKTQQDYKDKLYEYNRLNNSKLAAFNILSNEISESSNTLKDITNELSLYKDILPKKKWFRLWGGRTTRRSIKNNKRITRRN